MVATLIRDRGLANNVKDDVINKDLKIVGICSVNREEWLVTDLACNAINVTSCPLYETLGEESIIMILQQTEMSTLFGSDKSLKNILRTI